MTLGGGKRCLRTEWKRINSYSTLSISVTQLHPTYWRATYATRTEEENAISQFEFVLDDLGTTQRLPENGTPMTGLCNRLCVIPLPQLYGALSLAQVEGVTAILTMELAPLLLLAALIVLTSVIYQRCKRSQYRPLPPGPKGVPIVGNIRDLPPNGQPEHEHWIKHKGLYGGISSITVKGMTIVILHHRKAAHELLVQRSSKTSGRPRMVMANEMCGYGSIVVCQDYTAKFRRCRKLLHQELGTVASAAQFEAVQEAEVRKQLVRGLHEPRRWLEHYKTYVVLIRTTALWHGV